MHADRAPLLAKRSADRILLVVAPTPTLGFSALAARGLAPDLPGIALRPVGRALQLRGWSHGTSVVADRISEWAALAGAEGESLAHVLLAQIAAGRLRFLQDDEIAQIRAGEA